jgi:hypothetical protein
MTSSVQKIGFLKSAFYLFQEAIRIGDKDYIAIMQNMNDELFSHLDDNCKEQTDLVSQYHLLCKFIDADTGIREEFFACIDAIEECKACLEFLVHKEDKNNKIH